VWRDYSRQHGAIVIQMSDYSRVTGDARAHDAALWLRGGAITAALLTTLKARLPQLPALDIVDTADVRAMSLKIFDRTFAVTYALEAVALVIGLAAMAAAFMGLIVARRKEFGMLRHLGLTRNELTRMITLEGAALAALGALLGLSLGVVLAAVLVFVINPQSFGWTMDFHIPVLQLSAVAVALIVAAAVSAWLTARQVLGTQDLARSVREDW
jgi:putative ABC transport system permease protein